MARLNLNVLHASKARLAARRAKIADRAARFKAKIGAVYDGSAGKTDGVWKLAS